MCRLGMSFCIVIMWLDQFYGLLVSAICIIFIPLLSDAQTQKLINSWSLVYKIVRSDERSQSRYTLTNHLLAIKTKNMVL